MDFLDRLVERQRNPRGGVRPELPSRYEPAADGLHEVEELTADARGTSEPLAAPSPKEAAPRVVEPPAVPATDADRPPSSRPPEERPSPRPPVPVPAPQDQVVPAREGVPGHSPPRAPRPRPREAPPRREASESSPSPVVPPPAVPALEQRREAVVLPAPMLPPTATGHAARVAVAAGTTGPEPAPGRPTTVSIRIGRIEVRPPEQAPSETRPRPEAPVTPPRPAYRPRLSLEDYLARPNRGRS